MDGERPKSGGIYVHFPFCTHRCFYCDFNVFTPPSIPHTAYTDAVLEELAFRARGLEQPARSLYFGGGTPSLWETTEIGRVVDAVRRSPGLMPEAEVTLEANPSDVSESRLAALLDVGINRLSLGVQAVDDPILKAADRRHDAKTAVEAVEAAMRAGFQSVTVDLMFGLPTQGLKQWQDTLNRVAAWDVPHLSIYALTVEPRTPLARLVRDERIRLPDDGQQAEMMFATRDVLRSAGYEHYEVSSYARRGHRAVHNSGYWQMRPYLGLGAGAHGYVEGRRWTNLRRVGPYTSACLEHGDPTDQSEIIDPQTRAFERVLTGLRQLVDGVDMALDWDRYETVIEDQVGLGHLRCDGTRIRLTDQGLRFMNAVLLAFTPDA